MSECVCACVCVCVFVCVCECVHGQKEGTREREGGESSKNKLNENTRRRPFNRFTVTAVKKERKWLLVSFFPFWSVVDFQE